MAQTLDWLRAHAPISDLDCYPESMLASFARHGQMLRADVPWCAQLPNDIFLRFVLFHRVGDEEICDCRPALFALLWPRVKGMTAENAILECNRFCHEYVTYEGQDPRTAPVFTVMKAGTARCGEESDFTVNALRAVGIAARQVYVPRWSHCDDNHAWVEAWDGTKWRFLGGCEPEPVLDRGCFNRSSSRAMLAHSRLFCDQDDPDALDTRGCVTFCNQIARYAKTRRSAIKVLLDGAPASGANVDIEILNNAFFVPVARMKADQAGEVELETGLGSAHVTAWLNGRMAEGLITGESLTLSLFSIKEYDFLPFHFLCPKEESVNPIPAVDEHARETELRRGRAIREARLNAAFDEQRASRFPDCLPVLRAARGNAAELLDFLERDDHPLRKRLLFALEAKDCRDARADVLEDHVSGAARYAGKYPDAVYDRVLLNPRIAWEVLTPWRGQLSASGAPDDPEGIIRWVQDRVRETREGIMEGLYWPPECALRAGRCDTKSLRTLTVALLRAKGIPARLSPFDDLTVEYWENGAFVTTGCERPCRVTVYPNDLVYEQDWSMSLWTEEGFKPVLTPSEPLPEGHYRVIVTRRLADGSQDAAASVLRLKRGVHQINLPTLSEPVKSDGDGLTLWVLPGEEPSERALTELRMTNAHHARVILPTGAGSEALTAARAAMPGLSVQENKDFMRGVEEMERRFGRALQPPVALMDRDGTLDYAGDGFNAGLIAQALRITIQKRRG